MNKNNHQGLPQYPASYWRDSVQLPTFSKYTEDIIVDVAIIGAGITGITTAYLLIKEGIKVALIDAGEILNGTTGHTTAKVTAQHGLIYDELIAHFGTDATRLYYEVNAAAIKQMKAIINELHIDCEWEAQSAYLYTNDDTYMKKLEKEIQAYQRLGINGEYIDSIPLNEVPSKAAVVMPEQAQFHPLKYLQPLVQYIVDNGGLIFEHTTAVEVEESDTTLVRFRNGQHIACQNVIAASHYPFYDGLGFYPTRMYAERAYIVAAKTKRVFPEGMYISAESPTRSLRYTIMDGEKVVLFVGEGHKTGQGIQTHKHYEALRDFAEQTYGIEQIMYRWSAQDLYTLDKLPFIGPVTESKDNVLIATGFRKWGMTNGTAAAHLLRDLVLKKENPYAEVVTPSRFKADPSVKKFVSVNVDVAKHLVAGKLEYPLRSPDDLVEDEGAVVNVAGKRAGAYKDPDGELYVVDTTCTHLGCEVEWNSGDRTWDCPCHGSRFSITGDIINGPAEDPLPMIDME